MAEDSIRLNSSSLLLAILSSFCTEGRGDPSHFLPYLFNLGIPTLPTQESDFIRIDGTCKVLATKLGPFGFSLVAF